MSSSVDVMLGVQEPQILHLPPGVVSLDAATEAIELAESCELILDESQCLTLEVAMGERVDGKWAAFEVADVEPRQSGKNDTIAVREMWGLFVAGDTLQLHTAHEAATANESFLRMESLISNNSELKAQVSRFRYGNGDHAVELKSGGRLLYKTRTGGAARGFAGASLLVYDEALFLMAKHVAASLATLARGKTRAHNPQAWSASSAALSTSSFLHSLRRRALVGNGGEMRTGTHGTGGRFAYVEHTAEVVEVVDGKLKSNRSEIDLDDRRLWALANPAMNHPEHGISEEFIESEQRAQAADPDGWARERLGIFDVATGDTALADPKIDPDNWHDGGLSTTEVLERFPKATTLAYEVTKDGKWSSISIGAGTIVDPFVQCVAHAQGVGWLPSALVEWTQMVKPIAVGFNGAGPAGAQLAAIEAAFIEAGLDRELLHQFSATDYRSACGGMLTDIAEGRLSHPAEGQGPLDRAALDATERAVGEAFAWDARTEPISPLTSATLARALLPIESTPKVQAPMFALT